MSEAEVEYEKLKGLLGGIDKICEHMKVVNLHEAELNLKANQDSPALMRSLAQNLRGLRKMYLSSLEGIIEKFG
jgi:hypothetical protein